ncbi:MAG: tryptophan synthase subunit alpha [Odoribacteraceae bacterium]|jgi:tryptophan synthase alpha chain|nr:tryptophan synthase subunit alpha [Odoribacteraceae bacterium]
MNKITTLFREKQRGLLSVYFTAGFPGPDDTVAIIRALQAGGVDMIEVGIPFSDPMADGPVIQQSSAAALDKGMTLKGLFARLATLGDEARVPLLLMGYLNPIMQYGFENFCRSCVETGVSGMIIPDLPFNDYLREYKPVADRHDLKIIMLVTPETPAERVRLIDAHTDGFIYLVSSASVTGTRERFDEQTIAYFRRTRDMKTRNPLMIGFGISNKATLDAALEHASGAIIGSKFVSLLATRVPPGEAVNELLRSLAR